MLSYFNRKEGYTTEFNYRCIIFSIVDSDRYGLLVHNSWNGGYGYYKGNWNVL